MTESRVYLKELSTGQLVEASLLDEVTDKHLALWNGAWQAAMQKYCAGRTLQDKPEDHHWDWKWKANEWRPMLGYHSFAIMCEGELQGLMLVCDFKSARIQAQFGKPIVCGVPGHRAMESKANPKPATLCRCGHHHGGGSGGSELGARIPWANWTSFPISGAAVLPG